MSSVNPEEVSLARSGVDNNHVPCRHYMRRCFLECPACFGFFPCRLCHDEKSNHQLDRYAVKRVKCASCQTKQSVSEKCEFCNTTFGKYCCLICNIFDDVDKKQYHCSGCGLCRVGGQENFFHCDKCGLCLSNEIRGSHKCVEKSSRCNCPICLEDLHTSTQILTVPACGHLIHRKCYNDMLKHGEYRCAICGKSTVSMSETWERIDSEIALTPMPEEYANKLVWILCKDCNSVTQQKFHVLGMKCEKCNSYNTCATNDPNE